MFKGARIAAVVPAHNEAAHIGGVIATMPDVVDHIVIVDDCSTDDTARRAEAVGDPRVVVVRHEVNQGVGGAILTGHRRALDLGADVNVVMAGDGQMDPDYLTTLLNPIVEDGYGFAKANRFFAMSSFDGMPRHRIFGNVVLSFFTKLASGYWHLFDPQNGYTAIHREALQRLDFGRIARGYSFENDLLVHLNIMRVPAVDVPIPAIYGTEVSGIKLRRVIPEMLNLLVRGFWKRFFYKYVLWSFSPIALFLLTGLFLTLCGLAVGGWVIAHTLGPAEASTGSVLLAVTPFIIGVNMIMYALMLDIQESPDTPVTSYGLPRHWSPGPRLGTFRPQPAAAGLPSLPHERPVPPSETELRGSETAGT
jgi:glycosyltransferase involved in cell wall biosynthesis